VGEALLTRPGLREDSPVTPTMQLDGVRLPDGRWAQLWQGGAADGPTVFFFHGCPDTRLAACTGDRAAKEVGVRLVAVSRPGYGASDPLARSLTSVADDTVAVANSLEIDRFVGLGMSVGGQYALATAARHPDRVVSVGVVATPAVVPELAPPCHRDDLDAEQREFFAQLARCSVTDAVELMRPGFEKFVAEVDPLDPDDQKLSRRWIAQLPPGDVAALAGSTDAELAQSAREALINSDGYLGDAAVAFRSWDVRPEGVTCPTWLWYGECDDNVSVRNGQWFADHLSRASLVVRAGSTHLATLVEHWDEILTALRDA
jgi:pimeloyl-ACP methyl ester carboxylesterase